MAGSDEWLGVAGGWGRTKSYWWSGGFAPTRSGAFRRRQNRQLHSRGPDADNAVIIRAVELRHLEPGGPLNVQRGRVAVCVVSAAIDEQLRRCLAALIAHTPDAVPLILIGAGAPDPAGRAVLDALPGTRELLCAPGVSAQQMLVHAAPADVVVLGAAYEVAAGWLDGLRAAAAADSTVATAAPLLIGSVLGSRPAGMSGEQAAARVLARSLRVRPRVGAISDACAYVTRQALELVGPYDAGFARRCLDVGLCHVIADEVLITGPPALPATDEIGEPLRRARGTARRAIAPLSVLVDARVLSGPMNGSQVHVLELLGALSRHGGVDLVALVPAATGPGAAAALAALPGLRLRGTSDTGPVADVVHRPHQVDNPADLTVLAALGERIVLTQQDLIGFHNPGYFRSAEAWRGYRQATRVALAVADRVLFYSDHVRDDALAEDLVEPARVSVVPIGVDHVATVTHDEPRPPAGVGEGDELIICLGTDLRHKNRPFALRLMAELQTRHGFGGRLILAGGHVAAGSSRAEEQRLLAADAQLAAAVVELGPISGAEKEWLLQRAALVLYPTVHEGFGLVPFEAADHGVPCLWAAGTSLSDVLPDEAAGIVRWDPAASAEHALALIRDVDVRAANVHAIETAARALRWSDTAAALVREYERACDEPPAPAKAREQVMQPGISEDAVRLVGPGGALPRDMERPLLALATHPRAARPLFGMIRAAYRAAYRAGGIRVRLTRGRDRRK
jgi:glycosyltransferase involved in cell wall biosynthesis